MSAVRGRNTRLETEVRRRLFAQGFRYRLHAKGLPEKPDMVFSKYSAVIFVNGCFWYSHGCARSTIPENRTEWWQEKLQDNKMRDTRVRAELRNNGWRVLIVWQCAIRRRGIDREDSLDRVCARAAAFLRSQRKLLEISGPMPSSKPVKRVGL
jgi:DNA mismatch endonuclease (patch repair protein)